MTVGSLATRGVSMFVTPLRRVYSRPAEGHNARVVVQRRPLTRRALQPAARTQRSILITIPLAPALGRDLPYRRQVAIIDIASGSCTAALDVVEEMLGNNCTDRMNRVVARKAALLHKALHRFYNRFNVLSDLIFDDDMNCRMDTHAGQFNALRGVIRLNKLDSP